MRVRKRNHQLLPAVSISRTPAIFAMSLIVVIQSSSPQRHAISRKRGPFAGKL